MSSGITLQELNKLFDFLKQSKTNDEMTILITNDMCKSLYELMENCFKYQDKLQSNWNSLRELIEQYLENEKYSYMSDNPKDRCRYDIFMEIKDKMNELEGGDNK